MHLIRVAATLAAAAALAACAQPILDGTDAALDQSTPGAPDPSSIESWRDFPVGRSPRPVVLMGSPLMEEGYRTNDAKLAVILGRIELAAPLPVTPRTVEARLPDGQHAVPVLPAAEAFARVRAVGDPQNAPGENPTPLRITKVELATAPFYTDRGRVSLPAWLFHAPAALGPLAWPAIAPELLWRPGEIDHSTGTEGALAPDGVTLTLTLPMPDAGPCPGEEARRYVPVLLEGDTAVAVGLRADAAVGSTAGVASTAAGPPIADCGERAMLRTGRFSVRLAAPLGNRVMVDATGVPIPITIGS
jgi:hypothetical protein